MESADIDKIKHLTNVEVVRRLLIKYFYEKNFTESFDRHVYPALLQDLVVAIPMLVNKIEVVPYAEEIDVTQGKVVLGWNLFVLGNNRMYLGSTYHNDMKDLARQIKSGMVMIPEGYYHNARRQTTAKAIITFITRVLGSHQSGYVDLAPATRRRTLEEPFAARNALMGMPQQFFTRSGGYA